MKKSEAENQTQLASRKFSPQLKNLQVSMSYEGLSLKAKQGKTLEVLRRQYAR
ncbi:hypothetical protein [Thaumasiovibrio subtropicus]|uniref:hypothetical protein n=1 Tax=Thaumasiovibrio subtropicus TaxID=1891207 RepID=UPI00186478EE|nr:hypothetical protein [Thaumasiovibrio subtropicus]